ncbi:MAG TPA: polysaccharide deacetylase family protein [Pirellulales bacterium]|nr:polysaccharide deacetylase family protein [Pirellulales bacterium]
MNLRQTFHPLLLGGYCNATLPYRRWLRARLAAQGRAPILVLFYHRIADDGSRHWTHSNRLFQKQIFWLERHCQLISLEEAQRRIRSGSNDRLAACITFDDGYSENCEQAIPLLIRHGIPCTYFVSSRHVLDGVRFAHDVANNGRGIPNTIEQLRWMAKSGVEIGAHTRTHADLGRVTDESQLLDEVIAAGEELEAAVDQPMRYFAFPYGLPQNLNAQAVQLLQEHGYEAFCSAYGDYNFPGDDSFHIRRFHADDMLRLKNWATIDPRHLKPTFTFDYRLSAPELPCSEMAEA